MTQPCPPAPNYARQLGIANCQYLQLTPYQKQRMYKSYMESLQHSSVTRNPDGYYKIGGYTMHHMRPNHIFGLSGIHSSAPRTNPVFGLGRSVLSVSAAQRFNGGGRSVKPSNTDTTSEAFINDLWTAQVLPTG